MEKFPKKFTISIWTCFTIYESFSCLGWKMSKLFFRLASHYNCFFFNGTACFSKVSWSLKVFTSGFVKVQGLRRTLYVTDAGVAVQDGQLGQCPGNQWPSAVSAADHHWPPPASGHHTQSSGHHMQVAVTLVMHRHDSLWSYQNEMYTCVGTYTHV